MITDFGVWKRFETGFFEELGGEKRFMSKWI
jgi:hypothetical protein